MNESFEASHKNTRYFMSGTQLSGAIAQLLAVSPRGRLRTLRLLTDPRELLLFEYRVGTNEQREARVREHHRVEGVTWRPGRWRAHQAATHLEELPAVVVGGGQAGLCCSYHLQARRHQPRAPSAAPAVQVQALAPRDTPRQVRDELIEALQRLGNREVGDTKVEEARIAAGRLAVRQERGGLGVAHPASVASMVQKGGLAGWVGPC